MQNGYFALFFRFELNPVISREGLLMIVNVEKDLVGNQLLTKGLTFAHLLVMLTPITLANYGGHTLYLPSLTTV